MLAQLEEDNQATDASTDSANETETEEEDDDALIYFEIDAINIALSIGAAALLSQILGSDSDSDDDSSFPVITINGDNPATVELGNNYNDAGATAVDSNGNSLNVSSTGNVNTNIVGTYTITYTATDSEGRVSIATRTVVVIDSTPPVY